MDTPLPNAEPAPSLNTAFEKAFESVQDLPIRPDNPTLLELYALYKQATQGNVCGEKPGFYDFVGVAKYEAWEKLQGVDADTAKRRYVEIVAQLMDS